MCKRQEENLQRFHLEKRLESVRIIQYDARGNVVKYFSDVDSIVKEYPFMFDTEEIIDVCEGKRKTAYGCGWSYENQSWLPKNDRALEKDIIQYTKYGTKIATFHTYKELKEFTGGKALQPIFEVCNKVRNSIYGYGWSYADETWKPKRKKRKIYGILINGEYY